jgi:hypothetical protein
MQERVLLLTKSAQERVASFLLDLAKRAEAEAIEVPMSRQDIADYLGLTIDDLAHPDPARGAGGHCAADLAADRAVQPVRFDASQRLTPASDSLTCHGRALSRPCIFQCTASVY